MENFQVGDTVVIISSGYGTAREDVGLVCKVVRTDAVHRLPLYPSYTIEIDRDKIGNRDRLTSPKALRLATEEEAQLDRVHIERPVRSFPTIPIPQPVAPRTPPNIDSILIEAEKKLREEEPYHLLSEEEIRCASIRDLLLFIILDYKKHQTFDNKNQFIQDGRNGRRSTHDLFLLCRHHIGEEITLKEMVVELVRLFKEGKIGTWYCSDIKSRVWKPNPITDSTTYGILQEDNYGITNQDFLNWKS